MAWARGLGNDDPDGDDIIEAALEELFELREVAKDRLNRLVDHGILPEELREK